MGNYLGLRCLALYLYRDIYLYSSVYFRVIEIMRNIFYYH